VNLSALELGAETAEQTIRGKSFRGVPKNAVLAEPTAPLTKKTNYGHHSVPL
jgi:hypothetical protein